jgi:hypothetical protein
MLATPHCLGHGLTDSGAVFSLRAGRALLISVRGLVHLEILDKLKIFNDLVGTRMLDLPAFKACNTVPQAVSYRVPGLLTITQNYWGSGLCPFSGIKKLEHDVSETGCFRPQVKGERRLLCWDP